MGLSRWSREEVTKSKHGCRWMKQMAMKLVTSSFCCDPEVDGKKSAVHWHLAGHLDCCHSYSDSSFPVLCCAGHTHIMWRNVVEAIFMHVYKPVLCVQKESVITLELFISNSC